MPRSVVRALVVAGSCVVVMTSAKGAFARSPVPEQAEARSPSVYTKGGLLGPMRLGPTVGIGAPDGLRFGLFTTWKGILEVGGALSMVPSIAIPGAGPAQVSRSSGEGFFRVHPFRGALYLGVAGGVARTEGSTSGLALATDAGTRVDLHTAARAVYLAPHLGFRWMLPFGMTVGFDGGVEIPVASNDPTFDATHAGETQAVDGKGAVSLAMNYAAHKPIPVLHLLEVGYAF